MKITSNPPAPKPASTPAATRTGGSGRAGQASGSGATSSTGPAARLTQLESQLAPSDFSATKVTEIASAIAAGRYQVNAGAVADGLLASTAALARKSGSGAN